MKLLFDTHAFLWFVLGAARISPAALAAIREPANQKLVSPASYWELAIKISVGKYVLKEPYETFFDRGIAGNGFHVLPIEPRHTAVLTTLPFHHRDPFDRLLVAQALAEQITLLSDDALLDRYGVTRVW